MAKEIIPDDIGTPDYRILVYLWDRDYVDPKTGKLGASRFIVDISSLATTDIHITKERNQPDSLDVTIEYTQFKEKLRKEGSMAKNVLMPWLTEIKIQRNFKTVFAGSLYSMSLSLSAVGREELNLKCISWGNLFDKRLVSRGFRDMSYPQIAQALITEGQHELNWIENYAFEYSDNETYFSEWVYNGNPDPENKPERASDYFWGEASRIGVKLYTDDFIVCPSQITTWAQQEDDASYTIDSNNYHGEALEFDFDYYCSGSSSIKLLFYTGDWPDLTLVYEHPIAFDNLLPDGTRKEGWINYSSFYGDKIRFSTEAANITYIGIYSGSDGIGLGEFQLYRTPLDGDVYDLDVKQGIIDPTYIDDHGEEHAYEFNEERVRHYHQQNIKEALYNLTKLEEDQFEYEFTEDKVFNCYKYQGCPVVDPALIASYPGIIQSLTVDRDIESITNTNYAHGDETFKLEIITEDGGNETKDFSHRWKYAITDIKSIERFGVLADTKAYDGVNGREDLLSKCISDLQTYADIKNIPTITVDSNIYNPESLKLGDAVGIKVLEDELFFYVNDVYRVYSVDINITKDTVEAMSVTLVAPTTTTLQMISFPKQLKMMASTIKRLEER